MTQKTVLNDQHRQLGARMVDFGGWDMPLHYGSQIEEHHAVRQDCGMFDVSHMCAADLTGSEAKTFLQHLLANNIDKLKTPGRALYSAMLNETGGVIDDLIIYYLADGQYRLVLNAGCAEKDLAWMQEKLGEWRYQASLVARRDLAMIAVQGPNAKARVWQVLPQARAQSEALKPFFSVMVDDFFIATTGYTGEDGFEITLPATQAIDFWQKLLAAGVRPVGLGARDTLRLEAGMNLYGQDMDETVSPLDAGLSWTVDLVSERDFVGKASLQKTVSKNSFLACCCKAAAFCAPIRKLPRRRAKAKSPAAASRRHYSNPSPSPACRWALRRATRLKSTFAASNSKPRSSNPVLSGTARHWSEIAPIAFTIPFFTLSATLLFKEPP